MRYLHSVGGKRYHPILREDEWVARLDLLLVLATRGPRFEGNLHVHSPPLDPLQAGDVVGEDSEQWLLDDGLMCLNDGSSTHVNRGTGGQSASNVTSTHWTRLPGYK